jgi:RimJ/RimL family protein N-acetyltransferase
MKIEQNKLFPLPIYTTISVGSIEGRDNTMFTLHAGMTEEQVSQLKAFSLNETDTALQNNTSDRKRFGEGSYQEWYANNRVPFSVIEDATGNLAALIWFGPKPVGVKSLNHITDDEQKEILNTESGNGHTIAYRAYNPYRGVGIMKKAVIAATKAYLEVFPEAMLWAIVDESNEASVGLSKALGYVEAGEAKDGFVVMVRES